MARVIRLVAFAVMCLIISPSSTSARAEAPIPQSSNTYLSYSRPNGPRTSDALLVDIQGKYVLTLQASKGDRTFEGKLSSDDDKIFRETADSLFSRRPPGRVGQPGETSVSLMELNVPASPSPPKTVRSWSWWLADPMPSDVGALEGRLKSLVERLKRVHMPK